MNDQHKMVAQCPFCAAQDHTITPSSLSKGIAVFGDAEGVQGWGDREQVIVDTRPGSEPPPPAARPTFARASSTSAGGDIFALMRRRRDELEMEVARLDAAKLELRKLNKMIAVADREQAKALLELHN